MCFSIGFLRALAFCRHIGDDQWHLRCDNALVRSYTTDDIRFAIVYRARCFRDRAESDRFSTLPESEQLQLDDVLETMRAELVRRQVLAADATPTRLELALQIMAEFIKYPHSPSSWLPLNYCSLAKLYPSMQTVLNKIC